MSDATAYEAAQNHSWLTAWLHGFRYARIERTAAELARGGAPLRLLEIGCAYGKAFERLDQCFPIDYVGVDFDPGFIAKAQRRYGEQRNFRAVRACAVKFVAGEAGECAPFDLVFALETLEHMNVVEVTALLEGIARLKPRLFVASVPVEVGPSILLKNMGSALTGYSRHKEYSFAATLWASLYRLDRVAPHAGGHKGFDWRWLAHTIHQIMPIRSIDRFPVNALPAALASSVYITAAPRD